MSGPAFVFHQCEPDNVKASYGAFDQCDMTISNEGRSFLLGSLRIEGELEVSPVNGEVYGSTNASYDKNVYYDRFAGAHSLVEQLSVEIGGGSAETLPNYARMVKSIVTGSQSQTDMINSDAVCELKAPALEITRETLMGNWLPGDPNAAGTDLQKAAVQRQNPDFSFKPVCVLNNSVGSLAYAKTGDMRLTLNLARAADCLFGNSMAATVEYTIKNLRCCWRSVPQDPKAAPVTLVRHLSIKQNIQSSTAALQLRVPAVCDSMFSTFQPQGDEGQPVPNALSLARPPGITQVQFLFSDATNKLITYSLRSQVEILERYADALSTGSQTSAITLRNVNDSDTFGCGLFFDGEVDLSNSKLTMTLDSAITNQDAYVVYSFFRSSLMV